MKIKIFKILCSLSFFIIFGYFFGDEYWEYREQGELQDQYQSDVVTQTSHFSLGELDSFGDDIELYYTPYLGLLDILVEEIDAAQEKIYVEVYIFTETNLRDALIRAHNRGIVVKILLENNPYKAPYLNDKHYAAFLDAGIDVKWSDPLNYSLNHSKLLLIDNTAYISTGNFSYSLFKYNRDFLVSFTEKNFVETLYQLFLQDFEHQNIGVYHKNLVLSPEYSRSKLTNLLKRAKQNIDFYFPYIADDTFQEILFDIADSGVKIRGVVEEKFYNTDTNIIQEFKNHSIELHALESDKLHGKAILVDDKYLYIGSVNFSSYSFDNNREIGVIISDPQIVLKFKKIFESDF